ncbi:hypothetical protein DTO271D3_3009 [Paecilomyces variotii]|nr:hypothetical protein DTO271D3_3009 [Paecilomyces variotii]
MTDGIRLRRVSLESMKLSKSPKEKMVCFTEEHKLSAGSGPFPTELLYSARVSHPKLPRGSNSPRPRHLFPPDRHATCSNHSTLSVLEKSLFTPGVLCKDIS